MPQTNAILGFFEGHWTLSRSISQPRLSLTGQSQFTKINDSLYQYHETGTCQKKISPYHFYQNFFFAADPKYLYIRKDNHDLLHQFSILNEWQFPLSLESTHHCKNDDYHCTLTLNSINHFEMAYKVIGIHKNYRIHTDFSRIVS